MQANISSLPLKQQEQILALRKYITIFANIIIATGLLLLGLSFYKGFPNVMVSCIGAMFICLGAFGIYAGFTLRLNAAKLYVVAIFVCMVISVILLGLELNLLNSWVNSVCHRKGFTALVCAQYRHFRWILAVICFVLSTPACCSCLFCAYSYQIALQPQRGRGDYAPLRTEPATSTNGGDKLPTDPTSDL